MAVDTDFPGSLDVIGTIPDAPFNQSQTILVNGTPMTHRDLMNFLFRATEAEQSKLGAGDSTAIANTVLRGIGARTTVWGPVEAGDLAAGASRTLLAVIGPLSTPQTNFDFNSIDQSWRHLSVEVLGRSAIVAASDVVQLRFNNDNSAIYANQVTYSNVAAAGGIEALSQNSARSGIVTGSTGLANSAGIITIRIPFYTLTTFNKLFTAQSTVITGTASGGMFKSEEGGAWRSVAAVTRVTLTLVSNLNFANGSVAALYGEP